MEHAKQLCCNGRKQCSGERIASQKRHIVAFVPQPTQIENPSCITKQQEQCTTSHSTTTRARAIRIEGQIQRAMQTAQEGGRVASLIAERRIALATREGKEAQSRHKKKNYHHQQDEKDRIASVG